MAFKLSNVIGAPFRLYIVQQLATRSVKNSTGKTSLSPLRTADEVLFLANKTAWVKLQSSVDVSGSITDNRDYYDVLKDQDNYDPAWWPADGDWESTNSALAQKWILQSGTSYLTASTSALTLREGIGYDGAYGLGGIKAQGYRPMPGLDSVTIETKGKLGSLRYATVNFKVWNMNQLDVIDALYFRLGFTMLLEWGHTQYYLDNDSKITPNATGIDIPFYNSGVTKESVNQAINKQVFETRGNYDGMLGVVTNFNYSMNQEGGWDCSIKLIGLGSLLDTQRITSNYRLPAGVADYYDRKAAELIEKQRKEDYEIAKEADKVRQEEAAKQNKAEADKYAKANPITSISGVGGLIEKLYSQNGKATVETIANDISPAMNFGMNYYRENNIIGEYLINGSVTDLSSLSGSGGQFQYDTSTELAQSIVLKYEYPSKGGTKYVVLPKIKTATNSKHAFENPLKERSIVKMDYGRLQDLVDRKLIAGNQLSNQLISEYLEDINNSRINKLEKYSKEGFPALVAYSLLRNYPLTSTGVTWGSIDNSAIIEQTLIKPNGSRIENQRFKIGIGIATIVDSVTNLELEPITPFKIVNGRATSQQYLFIKGIQDSIATGLNPSRDYLYFTLTKNPDTNYPNFVPIVADQATDFDDNKSFIDVVFPEDLSFTQKNTKKQITTKKVRLQLRIETNMLTALINDIKTPDAVEEQPAIVLQGPVLQTGDYTDAELSAIKKSSGIESALEAMLRIVQYETLNANWKGKDPKPHRLIKSTGLMLTSTPTTLFSSIFKPTGSGNFTIDEVAISTALVANDIQTNPLSLGLKGFNTSLMSGQSIGSTAITSQGYGDLYKQAYDKCYPADVSTARAMFEGLCNSFFIPYTVTNTAESSLQVTLSRPVYIKLGYLLFFINNYCLLYDTSKGDNKARPFFYIDFNPETNLCFTMPHQLSVDPFTCLIPFGGNDEDYKEIFTSVSGSIKEIFNGTVTNTTDRKLFTTEDDILYDVIKGYQTDQPYTAKPMEILLNVEHLLNLLKSSTEADGHGGVYLKPFLDAVATDVNKALGDMNALRVAYYDPSNTVVIVDDQFVTAPSGEENVVQQENSAQKQAITQEWQSYLSRNNTIIMPVYGPGSLVRTFQFETNITTKMSSMIAIGATSGQASAQGIDGTGFRALSKGLVDRVITERTEVAPTTAFIGPVQPQTSITPKDNNQEAAPIKFNQHIKRVYGAGKLDTDDIRAAENYLIINSANVKAGNSYTNANPVIPLNCSFTMDGIGGIMMGNCFLLPNEIMPISVRGNGGLTKFGFIVNKLDHSIQNNEWLTTIGGQMIRLKDVVTPATRPTKKGSSRKPRYGGSNTTPNTGGKRGLSKVKQIVLHHTTGNGNATPADIVKVLNDDKNSAHYIIARDGTVFNMVPLNEIAYHAKDFNSTSVGIELINHGAVLSGETIPATEIVDLGFSFNGSQKYQNYTAAQLQSLTKVLKEIMQKCPNIKKNYTNTALSIYQNVFGLKNLTAEPARNSTQTSDKLSTETNNIPGIFIHAAVGTSTHTDTQPTAELFEVLKKI